jgi:hypothetical protein
MFSAYFDVKVGIFFIDFRLFNPDCINLIAGQHSLHTYIGQFFTLHILKYTVFNCDLAVVNIKLLLLGHILSRLRLIARPRMFSHF